jgi:hypothetical protein
MLLEEELVLTRLKYKADDIKARIAELTEQRRMIREQGDEANDAAIRSARENAANRSTQLVREHRQTSEAQKDELMLCDFCSSIAPAWRYPAVTFSDLFG